MDLAKIRKQSLQMLRESCGDTLVAPSSAAAESKTAVSAVESPVLEAFLCADAAPVLNDLQFRERSGTPLEAILAGRKAAGCDSGAFRAERATGSSGESSLEFLSVRVSHEIYGINIMDIKEIIKPRETTEIPRAPLFISGVISLRGTILPVIDLRVRLGLESSLPVGMERIIVVRIGSAVSGLLVDEVLQVVQVPAASIEEAPVVLDGVDRDFVRGLGRAGGRLMIILNLDTITDINLY